MNRYSILLRILLWIVCLSHVAIGAGLNLVPGAAETMADLYGARVEWTPELTYILKPLGAFMLALGLVAASAAMRPLQSRAVIYAFVVLFVVRALQRLLLAGEIADVFAIEAWRNYANMAFFLLLAAALVVSERMASRAAR